MTDSPFPLEPTAAQAQAAIKEEFAFFADWSERYQYLIDLGRKLPPFPDAWKTEEHRLLGCQSLVWIVPQGDAPKPLIGEVCSPTSVTMVAFGWSRRSAPEQPSTSRSTRRRRNRGDDSLAAYSHRRGQ